MAEWFRLTEEQSVGVLIRRCLEKGLVEAFLAPSVLPHCPMVQHVLIKDPRSTESIDPFAPVLPVNGAVLTSRLTRSPSGPQIGALLRPCEIRALVELVKLNQARREGLLIIGVDCVGTFEPRDYLMWSASHPDGSIPMVEALSKGKGIPDDWPSLRTACRACEYPTPEGSDIQILIFGCDPKAPHIYGATARGVETLEALGLHEAPPPEGRDRVRDEIIRERVEFRDGMFELTKNELLPMEKLLEELSICINCHNCRVVCPVCYCRTCVFEGPTFEHPPERYLQWVKRKGKLKMPAETLFFHITRMAHMSTSCVGCGMCSSACPMGIRVMEVFRTVASRTQALFDYVPGRDLEEPLPLATFREEELQPR